MSSTQKLIKYFALAFAWVLIFSIFSALALTLTTIGSSLDDNNSITEKLNNIDFEGDFNILEIDISTSKLIIKEGDFFKAETSNKYISCKQDGNKLFIEERKHSWFSNNDNNELIVYIPKSFIFDAVAIDTGAGKVDIEELITKKLYLNLGAGKVEIDNLVVSDEGEINGGAGEFIIKDGNINDLNLDMGVGRIELNSKLTGESIVDSGIGEISLNLIGKLDDYKIIIDKGIGSATLNGTNMSDDTYYGNGSNKIDIDGGIGTINISLKDK